MKSLQLLVVDERYESVLVFLSFSQFSRLIRFNLKRRTIFVHAADEEAVIMVDIHVAFENSQPDK